MADPITTKYLPTIGNTMADLTAPAVLQRLFQERIPDLKLKSAKTLMMFNANGMMDKQGWQTMDWLVSDAGTSVGTEAITDNTTGDSRGVVYPAQLYVGRYREKHTMTVLLQDLAVARSRGVGALKNLLQRQIDDALIALTRKLNNLIYAGTGDGSKGAAGMGDFIGLNYVGNVATDSSNVGTFVNNASYAGISSSTVAAWKPLSIHNGGTPKTLTRDDLLKLDELVMVNESAYDTIMMHPSTATAYTKVWDSIGQTMSIPEGNTVTKGNVTFKPVDLGHNGRYYNGIPIAEDPMCPKGVIYFLDSSVIRFVSFDIEPLPDMLDVRDETQRLTAVTDADLTYGLPFHITQMPSNNPDALTFTIRTYPALKVENRKGIAVLSDVAIS